MRVFFSKTKISLPRKDINIAFDDVKGGTFVWKNEWEYFKCNAFWIGVNLDNKAFRLWDWLKT